MMIDWLERYPHRKLDPASNYKPLDFGGAGITGSVNRDGRITAVNAYHPAHGYVTMSSAAPFPEVQRYHPSAVRAYRANLATQNGFGVQFATPIVGREAYLLAGSLPCLRLRLANGIIAEMVVFVPESLPLGVVQLWRFSEAGPFAWLSGQFGLQRCAYTQLTEGGPVPMPPVQTTIAGQDGGLIMLENRGLGWAAALSGTGIVENEDGSVRFAGAPSFNIDADTRSCALLVACGMDTWEAESRYRQLSEHEPAELLEETLTSQATRWAGWQEDSVLLRGLVYSVHCCVPTGEETTCMITDHQLLPLSWNRDSYYAAAALLKRLPEMAETVRRHLLWLFEQAERPDGVWGRSYLANGKVKDVAFQLDQQVFPLLELAEYTAATGDRATLDRLRTTAGQVIDDLLAREVPGRGLFPTAETPADDPVHLPYHLSSHILLWYVLRLWAGLDAEQAGRLSAAADRVREAVWRDFVVTTADGQKQFAYLTDGDAQHQLYHDANDIPLALAPAWGFCPADDAVWRVTVMFAYSEQNTGGFYPGVYGGLGSVHTPAPWPLGDVQALIIARLTGDTYREQDVRERLNAVAQWDGALPEAYDALTGRVVSRHWFSWPGAAYALYVDLPAEKAR